MGPMTGRGMGFCTGHAAPGYQKGYGPGYGCGYGYGFRHHYGNRHMYNATVRPRWSRGREPEATDDDTAFDEKTFLKNQVVFLKEQLDRIDKRLSDLENDGE
jgi:hypothetical protein